MRNPLTRIRKLSALSLALCGFTLLPLAAQADTISLIFDGSSTSSNTPATGASGTVDLTFTDQTSGDVLLTLDITNTTGTIPSFGDGATTSKLTGFGFNLLTDVTYVASSFAGDTNLTTLLQNANAAPFGPLDLAVADNNNWQGGNANNALPQGSSNTVSLQLTVGAFGDASGLASAFFEGFSDDLTSVMRFQQVNAGAGSDKLTNPTVVPLPAAAWLFGSALLGMAGIGYRGTRKS